MNEHPNAASAAATEKLVEQLSKLSRSKLQKMARKAELSKNYKVYPPGSRWKRRDGSYAYAGPPYGGTRKGKPGEIEDEVASEIEQVVE